MRDALRPTADPAWVLAAEGFDPLRESIFESRFAISNGFLGVRAARAVSRGARWVFPSRTYVAGLFDTPDPEHAVPVLVTAADWLRIRVTLLGRLLVRHPAEVASHRATLDMRRGAFLRETQMNEPVGVHVRTLRLVSLSQRAIGLQLIELEFQHGEAEITLEAPFAGAELELMPERLEQDIGVWRTKNSGKRLAMAAATSLQIDGQDVPPAKLGKLAWSWTWKCRAGQVVHFERRVAVARSDTQELDPAPVAQGQLGVAGHLGWRNIVREHEAAWSRRWQSSDVEVHGDPAAQRALRFAGYHLNSAANPNDDRVSIGARALTGDDYHGHVFWDTEIYLLPFYVFTWPEAARALLMYRFRTLDGARAKAARMGWRGALYAWESADSGAEVTPDHVVAPDGQVVEVLSGRQEQHISADVAYAVWQYWQATGDDGFLLDAGAEILLETGRFWSSRARPEADGYCHIRGVIGPDEYHENIDDNAFTNVMARWNIRRALDVATLLRERWPEQWASLSSRLGLSDGELMQWRTVAETMATGLDPKTGLFEQFAGYFSLEDINLADYAERTMPMDVVLGRERTQRSQVVKQADVVALLALLPEEFPGETAATNFRYYEPRCGDGSSLSAAMHGLVAARLGDSEMALRYFQQASAVDLADTHVKIAGGVHIAALGGIWQLAVFGFAGLSLQSDGIALDPKLPPSWQSLGFGVQWRGRQLQLRIDQTKRLLEATLQAGEPMMLVVGGMRHELRGDQATVVRINGP
ncbi:MAG TPA: glycosyl hydrolase family 65 protein [Acetobacteraceae bacterium]|nr:glycosyl hydrolase family 65 protein [Acetobacteraceae bacterium]